MGNAQFNDLPTDNTRNDFNLQKEETLSLRVRIPEYEALQQDRRTLVIQAFVRKGCISGLYMSKDEHFPSVSRKLLKQESFSLCSEAGCDRVFPRPLTINGGVCLTCVKPEASFKESQVKNNMGVPCEHATEFMAKALKMKSRIRWLRRNYFFALGKPMDDIIYGREDFVNNSFPEGDAADHSAGAAGDAPAGKDDSKEEKNSGGENGEEEEEDPSRRDPDALNEKDEANSREIIMMGGQTGTVFAIRAFVMPPKSRLTPELDAAFDICPQFPASQTIEGGADYLLSLRAVSTSSVTIRAYWTRNPDLGKLREPVDQKDAEAFLQETVDAEAARAERIRKAEEERKAAEEARLAAIAAEKAAKARPAPAPAPAQAAPTPAPAGAEAGKAAADPAPASAPAPAAADDQKGDNSV